MDKETLSNYGWIVICVLVLAVMIALAGPFGTFVAGAVKSTTAGLFGVNQNALGAAGIEIGDQAFDEGGNGGAGDQGGTGLPAVGVSAEDCTWDEIKAISEAGKGDEYFNLGDTKTFTTTDGKTIVMEIVAFNADTKADGTGTAGITWLSKGIIAERAMNLTATNQGGWKESEMRTWLQNDFYSTLPNELKNTIISVQKTYWDHDTKSTLSCDDNLWIPSYREIVGDNVCENSGVSYSNAFTTLLSRYRDGFDGGRIAWWLRSSADYLNIPFWSIWKDGTATKTANSLNPNGVVLGFCT